MPTEDGLRLADSVQGEFPEGFDDRRICYWRDMRLVANPPVGGKNGWMLYLPGAGACNLSLRDVDVTEHEDGTITVSPSILRRATLAATGAVTASSSAVCGSPAATTGRCRRVAMPTEDALRLAERLEGGSRNSRTSGALDHGTSWHR